MIVKKKLKLKPVKKLISREIKFEDGMPRQVMDVALRFAFLSPNEHKVLVGLKEGKEIDLPKEKLDLTVRELIEKGLITEN